MRQEFCLNHSSGLNAQNILSRILDQARLTGGLPKPVFLAFLSVAPVYHARVGHDQKSWASSMGRTYFNPRARVGRDRTTWYFAPTLPHFNPRAPCGARLTMEELASLCARISIHTPRMGARRQSMRIKNSPEAISIHAPRMGRDSIISTSTACGTHFNPRAPCGARHADDLPRADVLAFQSTRPHRARQAMTLSKRIAKKFQSTRPRGARLRLLLRRLGRCSISIHAPAWGRDRRLARRCHRHGHFNPRARMGARHLRDVCAVHRWHFNPRARMGARRGVRGGRCRAGYISIHAPAWGRDPSRRGS